MSAGRSERRLIGTDFCQPGGRLWPRLCENSFRPPRRIANRRIGAGESPETASTWPKLTGKKPMREFSHSLGRSRTVRPRA
jgi:hypothetical protein